MSKPLFDPAVTALLDVGAHPLRKEIDALRAIILSSDGGISEGVKWNTASFRTSDWFATLNGPRQWKEAMVILHAGAKKKDNLLKDRIDDPMGLVTWMGTDRGMVTFTSMADIEARRMAIQNLIRAWIAHL